MMDVDASCVSRIPKKKKKKKEGLNEKIGTRIAEILVLDHVLIGCEEEMWDRARNGKWERE